MAEVEVRVCPLGPPRAGHRVAYAWCSECGCVRKSTRHCPMIEAQAAASNANPGSNDG